MKRLFAVLLVFCLTVALAGCGSDGEKEQNASAAKTPEQVKATQTPTSRLTQAPNASAYNVGDVITLGAYEQDNDTDNGKEPIEWIVIGVEQNGTITLVSRYALDVVPYNENYAAVTWENCSLRKWLNEDFFAAAFTPQEQARLQTAHLMNEANPSFADVSGGRDTHDKVWLLSIDEACDYFTSVNYAYFTDNASRMCATTEYAASKGVYKSAYDTVDSQNACLWWLRSPGDWSMKAAFVDYMGIVEEAGSSINADYIAVRPVICILL